MASSIKPYILASIAALFLLNNSNICHAGYEIYSAKTIQSSAAKTSLERPDPVPYDLFQMDDEAGVGSESSKNDEDTILGKLFDGIKKRRIAKKLKDNPIPDEDDESMAAVSAQGQEIPIDEKNKFQIKADKVTYDDADGNVYARGHVSVFSKAQNLTVKSDNAVLDKVHQTIQFLDNVRVIKNGVEMRGQSLFVDLNEENILMDDPTVDAYSFTVRAQQAFLVENDIQMTNGFVKNNNNKVIPFVSQGFQILDPFGPMALYDYTIEKKEDAFKQRPTYSIKAKEMVITNYKDHDAVDLKKSDIFYGKHKIIRNADIEFFTDKDRQIVETNVPEVGSLSDFGTYLGYGVVKKLWGGQSIKLMPALVYHSGPGIGIIGRHQSRNNSMEAGWATAKSNFVLRGKYKLGKKTALNYGVNSYMDEGFLGARRPRYGVQLRNEHMFFNRDLNLSYKQGIYGGFYTDYFKQSGGGYYSTSRFRYLGQLSKNIKKYQNKEQDLYIALDAVAQGGVTSMVREKLQD